MKNLVEQLKERIPSVEAAHKETGRPVVDFSNYPEDMRDNREANYTAVVLVEAARKIEKENGLGDIDWDNYDQWKYIPYFRMSPSGFAFDGSDCHYACACAGSGSRLFVLADETARYLAKTFIDVWKKVQIG